MSYQEYKAAILCAAQVSELLNKQLDDTLLDLFERYGCLYEKIIRYETLHQK